jgi:tetratricopeptide (TPR) repeat protein
MSTAPLGTLPYMAPEQARNPARAVIESDVYSLGATLYEAITGRTPFQAAESLVALLEQLETQEPVPPRRINPRVDRDLETICLKCLEKEPQRRYSSALGLAEDLGRYRRHEPIEARPVSPLERLKKWTRRNPVAAALVTVTALLLLAVFAIVQAYRIADELRRERNSSELGYKVARDSWDEIVQFAERRLGDRPADLQALLAIVSSKYRDFLARRQSDPRFARETATVLTRMARITSQFGTQADALKTHEQALQIRTSLVHDAPDDLSLSAELAETWHDIGILRHALGQGAQKTLAAYREALRIRQDLVTRARGNRSFWSDLARSHGYIGDVELESGLAQAASVSYETALEIRKRLYQEDRDDLSTKFQLARSYNNGGHLERAQGGLEKTDAQGSHLRKALDDWHAKALELQRELAGLDPADAEAKLKRDTKTLITFRDFQSDLASTHLSRGMIWSELGSHGDAESEYEQALTIFDQLIKDYQGVTQYQGERAWVLTELGLLRKSSTDLTDAARVFEDLVRDNSKVTRFRAGRARNMAARGMLLLKSAATADEGRRLLEAALEVQRVLRAADPEKFDYQSDVRQTEAALNSSAPRDP